MQAEGPKFEIDTRALLNQAEYVFLKLGEEVSQISKQVNEHKRLRGPTLKLLKQAKIEKAFLERYRYSAGSDPEISGIIDMLDQRQKLLSKLLPMRVPLKELIQELKNKYETSVFRVIEPVTDRLFSDMDSVYKMVDLLKNDLTQIDLMQIVKPVFKPFADFLGERLAHEWRSGIESLKDFENKIYVPLDTYTVVYFSVRDSVLSTVGASIRPFLMSMKKNFE